MIDLITKFVEWIKQVISLIIGFPSTVGSLISAVNSFLSFLPAGLGTIITGLMVTCVLFVIVYAIVKLVTNLL